MTEKGSANPGDQEEQTSTQENQDVTPEVRAEDEQESGDASSQDSEQASNDEELHLMLEDARSRADEHWNQLLRANAELENARKRARQDVENAHKFALEKFALELLPVKDSLEMGLAAASNGAEESGDASETATQLVEGTKLTLKMLTSAMEKFGIEEINPNGESFNPDLHQAMSMQESAEHEPNTVMMVMQKGYQLNERLIRPAMVVVSKAVSREKAGEKE